MKLEQVLFPDGQVEKYDFNTDELKMHFTDSSGSKLLLSFSGNVALKEQDCIGLSVYRSQLDKEGFNSLRLLDDDLKEMLTIRFRVCQVECVSP